MTDASTVVAPGGPAVAFGTVWHRRNRPTVHEFSYPVAQVWFDPDRPEDLFDRHPLWSSRRRRPIRFRRQDHLDGTDAPIGPRIRAAIAPVLGGETPTGPLRILTQPRTWGWLFNPITVHLAWNLHDADPAAAVLEVTNTPWKERTLYPLALSPTGEGGVAATFDKSLHVSPFLDGDLRYNLRVSQRPGPAADDRRLTVNIDATRPGNPSDPVVETALDLTVRPPNRRAMTAALTRTPLPTHRVSAGIHLQALRLWVKRVPFVPHPSRRP